MAAVWAPGRDVPAEGVQEARGQAKASPCAPAAVLELQGLSKRYGTQLALDGVSLQLRAGEVHALLGENGAGKSTLCHLVFGAQTPSAGQMRLHGRPHAPSSTHDALASGVAMVHQHFSLIPSLSVIDNLLLGHARRTLSRPECLRRLASLCTQYGFALPPTAPADQLSVGQMQQLEIAKCLLRRPHVLVLDEPTAVLDGAAIDALIGALRHMAAEGLAVLLVTHKLAEIRDAADHVSVLRHGRLVDHGDLRERDVRSFVASMMGRDDMPRETPPAPAQLPAPSPASPAPVQDPGVRHSVRLEGLSLRRDGRDLLRDVSLSVRPGELLGVAGVEGNGQSELAAILSGQLRASAGRVNIGGIDTTTWSTAAIRRLGVGIVPEDRHRDGCIAAMSVAHNLFLDELKSFRGRLHLEDKQRLAAAARERMAAFDVRAEGPWQPLAALSGGNQQKVVLARELSRPALQVVIAVQPTRGLDVGAVRFVYQRLARARDQGASVIVFSSELDELMAHCDRIAVLYKGRLSGPLERPFTRDVLGDWMAGIAAVPIADEAAQRLPEGSLS